jgi:hypothetical protein
VQQKQVVQIIEDSPDNQISGLYVVEDEDYLSDTKIVTTIKRDRPTRKVILVLYTWIVRIFRLATITLKRILSWLNRLGRSEIDTKAIGVSHNYRHTSRIKGMTH